jgi:ribosome-associated toxin RatA of RatAB toxin-antitoxin module
MTTKVEKSILVNVPVSTAYNQWTQFEDFPQFMGGVKSVKQLDDDRLEWVAEIAGVRRQWMARILEQVPDQRVAWAATEGATNAGAVTFEDIGGGQTSVHLSLEYEPEGLVEKVGDKFNIVENQAEADLDRFKAFIESEGYATGAWRGSVSEGAAVGTPGVDEASSSRGDSGKAGVSGKAVAAGLGAAAAVAAGAAAVAGKKGSSDTDTDTAADTEDRPRMDVGVPFEATPTYAGGPENETVDRGVGYDAGGAPGTDVYPDRTDDTSYPPDNTLGQPANPDRT